MLIIDGEEQGEGGEVNFSRLEINSVRVESNIIVKLNLNDNRLTDLALGDLPNLKVLNLFCNQLIDVKLENLPKLETLDLYDNRLTDVKLEKLPNLTVLYLDDNQLIDLELENLPNLNKLYLNNNQLIDLKLENLPNLMNLYLDNNNLTNSKLKNLPKLAVLYLSNNPELAFLGNFFSLRRIYLDNTSIKFVDPLMVEYVKGGKVSPREHQLETIDMVYEFLPYPIAEEIVPEIEV